MKTLIRNIRTMAAFAAALAIPHLAFAAKSFGSLAAVPASTNITVGLATNLAASVTFVTGSGGSFYAGEATFVMSVAPSDPTVTAALTALDGLTVENGRRRLGLFAGFESDQFA